MTIDITTNQSYGDHPRHQLDIYTPEHNPTGSVVVFWHGGSWQRGDKKSYAFMGRALARLGYTAVLPNYRLYPEVSFPAFAQDAALAVAWVKRELAPRKVVVMGHSAGAQIAGSVAFDPSYLGDIGAGAIDGFVGLAGAYDFRPAPSLRPVLENSDHPWKPIDQVGSRPIPSLLVHGRVDAIVGASNSARLAAKLRQHGGDVTTAYYRGFGHFTVLAPFAVGRWIAPSMRRRLASFINSL